jgi:integrase/recombinase XerD
MLKQLFPRSHRRYSSLPLLGASLDGFARWLLQNGRLPYRVRQCLQAAGRIDRTLRLNGARSLGTISQKDLDACAPPAGRSRNDPKLAATVHGLQRYFEETGLLAPAPADPLTLSRRLVASYRRFLEDIRGLSASSVANHCLTAARLLDYLGYEERSSGFPGLVASDIEAFVCVRGRLVSRASLQHEVAHLRSFLRFLAFRGEAPNGLDEQIDTPLVYRLEKLPRALPWETVGDFLHSIDRSTSRGLRDYAIFVLMATYGLRASDIVALTLDDIDWRAERIRFCPCKTQTPLWLPLTDTAKIVLVDYLSHGRPALPQREIFLGCRNPSGSLGHTAVSESFRAWFRRSGLSIPSQGGSHCLRHSYAVHLLRQGTPLKTIGDLLGHHSAESTGVYLRLAIEDLRDVALPLPEVETGEDKP